MGRYLLEAKESTPAPSPTCTGGLRPPAPSPAGPEGQLTEAGLRAGRRCAGCGQGRRRRGGSGAAVAFPYGEVA